MHASGATITGDLARLTEPEVARLFDPRIYQRGKEYFEEGRVQRPIVYHDSLMADVRGTLPEDYHVSVDARDRKYVASCTCPYAFGYCKHIAAVMYAWVKRPALFRDLGRSEDVLKRLGKEEIVEIVIDMIRYDPDVLYVINLRLTPAPELPGFVDREVRNIFAGEYVDYLNVREIAKKLEIFREYAIDLARARDLSTAITVLTPVIDAVIASYTKLDDVDGLMKNFFGGALDTFAGTLAGMRDEGKRRALVTKAVDWYMEAEWGLEDELRGFLRDVGRRLGESRFLVNTIDLRVADYRRSLTNTGPLYSEEHEYLDERVRRLSGLRADILADGRRAIEARPGPP